MYGTSWRHTVLSESKLEATTTSLWHSIALQILNSMFLSYSDLFLPTILGVEGFWCTWSHSVTHTHTHTHTHAFGTPSGRGIGLLLRPVPYNTQHSQQTDTHTRGGIQTRNPSKWSAAGPHLRRRIHRDQRVGSPKRELPDYVEHIYVISVNLTTVSVTQIIVNGRMNSE